MNRSQSVLVAVSVFIALALAAVAPTQDAERVLRIGSFDRTRLLVAYYCSELHADFLHGLEAEKAAAEAAGDAEKVRDVEARGAASQEHAHRQLAGDATLKGIVEHLAPHLDRIAQQAGVDLIVETPLWRAESVALVDVTDPVCAVFPKAKKKAKKD